MNSIENYAIAWTKLGEVVTGHFVRIGQYNQFGDKTLHS